MSTHVTHSDVVFEDKDASETAIAIYSKFMFKINAYLVQLVYKNKKYTLITGRPNDYRFKHEYHVYSDMSKFYQAIGSATPGSENSVEINKQISEVNDYLKSGGYSPVEYKMIYINANVNRLKQRDHVSHRGRGGHRGRGRGGHRGGHHSEKQGFRVDYKLKEEPKKEDPSSGKKPSWADLAEEEETPKEKNKRPMTPLDDEPKEDEEQKEKEDEE